MDAGRSGLPEDAPLNLLEVPVVIKLSISTAALSGTWIWREHSLHHGGSRIEPLRHPALETATVSDGVRTLLCVRERTPHEPTPAACLRTVSPPELDRLRAECLSWPLEHLTAELDRRRRTVRLATGAWGTLPLHLVASRERLDASWRPTDLTAHVAAGALDDHEVCALLAYRHRYGHATCWRDVKRLTERSTATFSEQGLHLAYPEPAEHGLPRELVPGAAPVKVFDALLADAVTRRPLADRSVGVQLSGGIDSANIAMALGAAHPGRVCAGALLIGGGAGEQQARRRQMMIANMRLAGDVTVSALTHLPFAADGARGADPLLAGPGEEPYFEAADALADTFATAGSGLVFTGFGGDEFSAPSPRPAVPPARRRPVPVWCGPKVTMALEHWAEGAAPSTVVPRSTLLALGVVGPLLVRRGLWPVSPFADPRVVRFGEWLPDDWRDGKKLLRDRLASAGLPQSVVRPVLRENFRHVMAASVRRTLVPLLRGWGGDLYLAQAGYVDPDALALAVERAEHAPEEYTRLYAVVALEHFLRGMDT
ncbi:asparagine synthase-related protein [Streptomyces boncukensis]|uniref:Asparagine synthase n=1 Tax=Streptomyces boncukensis TaxID=2711219 RepID=A0A6G4X691_9ACTN|nr:asparagine synthase-related protein [Streptomyces boncukensis]NGO72264.1 asparagine synthase [Streptomyces boncukensis]